MQWQYSINGSTWANLSGATSPTLSASGLSGLENGWQVQVVLASVGELDARTSHQRWDGAGDEHLAGAGKGRDAGTDVDGQTGDVVASKFDLTGVNPGSYVNVQRLQGISDGQGAFDGATGAVEGGQEAIAGVVNLPAPESLELLSDRSVVAFEQVPPTSVPELRCPVGGAHDVGEQHGGQDSLGP